MHQTSALAFSAVIRLGRRDRSRAFQAVCQISEVTIEHVPDHAGDRHRVQCANLPGVSISTRLIGDTCSAARAIRKLIETR